MRDGFLKPRDDLGGGSQALFRQVAPHFVAKPHLNAAVPKPSDLKVYFAVVNLLKFNGRSLRCLGLAAVRGQLASYPSEFVPAMAGVINPLRRSECRPGVTRRQSYRFGVR
jgi:hypothetical protein